MVGFKTGKLTVIQQAPSKYGQAMWLCKCECGNYCAHTGGSLRRHKVKSCGCVYRSTRQAVARISIAKETHGGSRSRLYYMWTSMKNRCYQKNDISYKNYGGRGIKICDEWKNNFSAFRSWAMSTGYDPNAKRGECTIDRIDVDGDYTPENCRWANVKEQSRNRKSTVFVTYNGERKSLSEWSEITGIPRSLIYARYRYGWDSEELFSPVNQSRERNPNHHKRQARFPRKSSQTAV